MALQFIKKIFLFFLALAILFGVSSSFVYANNSKIKKILIIPFSFNSDDANDLTFLKKGIDRMLHTRLTHINKTKIIFDSSGKNPMTLAKESSSDYVLTGSITMYGQKISTDASLFSIQEDQEVLNFGEFGATKGDAIEHINNLAAKINIDILGILPTQSNSQHMAQQSMQYQRDNYYAAMPQYGSARGFKFQSRPIEALIKSIAIGDVDGDNNNEIIFITQSSLNIITFQNKKELLIAKIKLSGFCTSLRVDTIDLDNDNKDEIIVSSSDNKQFRNSSVAFKYDNKTKTLKKIPIYSNAFYSTSIGYNNTKILIGQKRSTEEKIFKGNIFKAEMIDGSIALSETTIHKPRNANIYTFTSGDIFHNNTIAYPVYDFEGYVNILDAGNAETWRTADEFGSSPVSFARGKKTAKLYDEEDKFYTWQRMHVADLNNDNKKELILVNNQLSSSEILDRTRTYRSGHIEILSWDEETDTLKKAWESRPHSGYIVDCIIGDMNNDGKDELIYAVVPKTKNLMGFMRKHQTYIFAKGF